MTGGLLAIVAHPDDESLAAGGALAGAAAAGLETAVISLSRGELGALGAGATREDLGAIREAELRSAAATLGCSGAECLGHPDGELEWVDEDEVVEELRERIEQARPRALVTFGDDGLYGHPDHVAVHRLVAAAQERASGSGDGCLWRLEAVWPMALVGELAREMQDRGLPTDLWGLPPEAFGVPEPTGASHLDVAPFISTKLAAIRCHRSQLEEAPLLGALPHDLALRFLGTEHFRPWPGPEPLEWLREELARAAAPASPGGAG
jgi:N-acetyl-1-D-myo-inositol-2-amino-2-deoxy-alpha-D-glucopyranoside deacetylase